MKLNKSAIGWVGCAAMLLALAACADSDDSAKAKADKSEAAPKEITETKAPTPICPQVAILRDLEDFKDYGVEKPDPSELVAEARMVSVKGNCAYDDNGIDVTFDLNFVAAKGPRLGGLRASFPYFVAVLAPDQTILNKDRLTVEVGFSSHEPATNAAESMHVYIPLPKHKRSAGPAYQVLMGFQLTKG